MVSTSNESSQNTAVSALCSDIQDCVCIVFGCLITYIPLSKDEVMNYDLVIMSPSN